MCVCQGIPFSQLQPQAAAAGWTLEDLMRETRCGATCGLCRPYLREMLRTGRTVFDSIILE